MNALRRRHLEAILCQLEISKVQLIDMQEDELAARDNIPKEMEGGPIWARANKYVQDIRLAVERLEDAIAAVQEALD